MRTVVIIQVLFVFAEGSVVDKTASKGVNVLKCY